MHFQILVHPKGIEGRGIKTCQKHIDHNQQIHLPFLHLVGQIFVIILKSFAGSIKIGFENLIIIIDCHFQKISGTLIKPLRIETFIMQNTIPCVCLIGRKGKNGCNGQFAVPPGNLFFQFQIVFFADRNGADRKHGIKTVYTLAFQTVIRIAHGFLVKMFQNILHHFRNAFLRAQCFFCINGRNLFIPVTVFLPDCIDIVNAERQDISVIDRIHDRIGMKFIAKRLLRSP